MTNKYDNGIEVPISELLDNEEIIENEIIEVTDPETGIVSTLSNTEIRELKKSVKIVKR